MLFAFFILLGFALVVLFIICPYCVMFLILFVLLGHAVWRGRYAQALFYFLLLLLLSVIFSAWS